MGLVHGGALVGVWLQQTQQHRGERIGLSGRGDLARGHLVQQGNGVVVESKRWRALERGVERGAQGEHVRGEAGAVAPGHFRGQVGGSPGQHPRGGHRDITNGVGDTEVSDLDGAVVSKQYVARLDVAVHNAGLVRGGQRGGDLAADAGDFLGWEHILGGQHRC